MHRNLATTLNILNSDIAIVTQGLKTLLLLEISCSLELQNGILMHEETGSRSSRPHSPL